MTERVGRLGIIEPMLDAVIHSSDVVSPHWLEGDSDADGGCVVDYLRTRVRSAVSGKLRMRVGRDGAYPVDEIKVRGIGPEHVGLVCLA
jgi:hypothetical protein